MIFGRRVGVDPQQSPRAFLDAPRINRSVRLDIIFMFPAHRAPQVIPSTRCWGIRILVERICGLLIKRTVLRCFQYASSKPIR